MFTSSSNPRPEDNFHLFYEIRSCYLAQNGLQIHSNPLVSPGVLGLKANTTTPTRTNSILVFPLRCHDAPSPAGGTAKSRVRRKDQAAGIWSSKCSVRAWCFSCCCSYSSLLTDTQIFQHMAELDAHSRLLCMWVPGTLDCWPSLRPTVKSLDSYIPIPMPVPPSTGLLRSLLISRPLSPRLQWIQCTETSPHTCEIIFNIFFWSLSLPSPRHSWFSLWEVK